MEHDSVLFNIGPLEITSPVVTLWALMAAVLVLCAIGTRKMQDVPGPLQNVLELGVSKLRDYFDGILGKKLCRKYLPVFGTFFIVILVSNYTSFIPGAGHFKGFSVPTASLSVTAGLAAAAFCATHEVGIRQHGVKNYLKSFLKPVALLLPLTLLEQFVRPFSLAMRLYGNLYGEEVVMENLYELFPIGLPLIMNVLSLLFCFIQAMVFTMLLGIYVSEAGEEEEE